LGEKKGEVKLTIPIKPLGKREPSRRTTTTEKRR